jgi:zeaxanthin glucosyltransferase
MARFGAFCFPGSGHINPMTALARALEMRGHSVVIFGIADIEARVRATGIEFIQVGATDYPPGTLKALDDRLAGLSGMAAFRFTIERVALTTRMILRDGPRAVHAAGLDALLVDEADSSGTIADHLGLPFISIGIVPPMNHDSRLPPFCFGWQPGRTQLSRFRNSMGMRVLEWFARPISDLLNAQRAEWRLEPLRKINDSLSSIAQITQMPLALEFPSASRPANVYFTGPFVNPSQRPAIDFPWTRLDGRPVAYASLGTLQNGAEPVFRAIAKACAELPLQLVLTLGGGIDPDRLGPLPGDPIVVPFAPQLDLLKRADIVITHAGINTVLEALTEGVPLVAIPLGNDQPGVAARLAARGAGVVVPLKRLTASRLRKAVQRVRKDPSYRARAEELAKVMRKIDGPAMAAEIIERSLQLSKTDCQPHPSA